MAKTNIKLKKILVAVAVLLVTLSCLPLATANSPQRKAADIPPDAVTFEEIAAQCSTDNAIKNNDNSIKKICVETADDWKMPSDVTVKMTKQDIYRLECFPGYFTPNQISADSHSQQMTLDYDPQPIQTIIIIDDDMYWYCASNDPWFATWEGCCAWANNILEGGDDYLEIPFQIDFRSAIYCYWDSPDSMDYYGLLDQIDGVDPTGVGCDVMVLMSGQNGGEVLGLANYGGRHFVMDVTIGTWPYYYPVANLFQHEASHLFECSDHGWDLTYCIMSYTYTYQYRGYCTGCTTQCDLNKYRFD